MDRNTHRVWVMQEGPCLGSCPGEERPRQRNVCGDRDSFELGL